MHEEGHCLFCPTGKTEITFAQSIILSTKNKCNHTLCTTIGTARIATYLLYPVIQKTPPTRVFLQSLTRTIHFFMVNMASLFSGSFLS